MSQEPPRRCRYVNAWPNRPLTRPCVRCFAFSSTRGHLASEQDGARYLYSPTVSASRARRSAMRHVLRTFFGGSVEGAVATLLELDDAKLTAEERARIQALIDEASKEGR